MTELDSELSNQEKDEVTKFIYDFFISVVTGEQALAKDMYKDINGINIEEVLGYIEWRANLLLQNLGLDKIFETKTNPMRWIMAYSPETINNSRADFFEKRAINYSKVTDFDDL